MIIIDAAAVIHYKFLMSVLVYNYHTILVYNLEFLPITFFFSIKQIDFYGFLCNLINAFFRCIAYA